MKSYMYGLIKAMTIFLDCNINNYTAEERQMIDACISKLNHIDNIN